MRLARFTDGSQHRSGIVDAAGSSIRALDPDIREMTDVIVRFNDTRAAQPHGPDFPLDRIKLLAPIASGRDQSDLQ